MQTEKIGHVIIQKSKLVFYDWEEFMNSKISAKIAGLMIVLGLILALTPIKITWAGSPNQSIPTAVRTKTASPITSTSTKAPVSGPSSTPIPPGTTAFPTNTPGTPTVTPTSLVTITLPVTLTALSATVTVSGSGGIDETTTAVFSATSTITLPVQSEQATSTLPASVPAQSQNGADFIPYIIGLVGFLLVGGVILLLARKRNPTKP
jgi:hypothetical protein